MTVRRPPRRAAGLGSLNAGPLRPRREKREKSLMPEGLAATMTVRDLASLLDYLRSLTPDAQKK